MVQEVRRIMFSNDELIAAYESHARMSSGFLPEGTIINCKPQNGCVLVTISGPSGHVSDLLFHEPEAIRPLIRYCLEHNILLPKGGQKSLFCKDGCASLYIVYSPEMEVLHRISVPAENLTPQDIQSLRKVAE